MLLSHRRRWQSGLVSTGTRVLLVLAVSGCGGSSLKTRGDGGIDGPGGHLTDGAEATGGAPATGGAIGAGGFTSVVGVGGVSGQASGGDMATGGTGGAGGVTGRGGTAGIGAGGATRNGGTTGIGGLPGKGGTTATADGGAPGRGGTTGAPVGGAIATGGRPANGGATGTGGRTAGTGGDGGSGGMGGSTGAAILQPLLEAFCAAAKRCCARSSFPKADIADCESQFPSRFPYYPLVDKGTVTVDRDALAACVAAYSAAATTCTITGLTAACTGIFAGAQAEGQPCGGGTSKFGAYECQPANGSASCYWQDSEGHPTKPGVCLGVPRGKAGDQCSRTCLKEQTCIVDLVGGVAPFPVTCFEEDGLYCSVATNPATCKPILQLDDDCAWDVGICGSGNYCHWTSNTCQPAKRLGEPCTNALCLDALECGASHTCIESSLASESVCKGTPSVP